MVNVLWCVFMQSVSVIPDNPAIMIEPTVTSLKPGSKYLKIASVTLTRKTSYSVHAHDVHNVHFNAQ